MKHTLYATLLLITIFLVAQGVGLFTVSRYIDVETTALTGNTTLYSDKYIIEPPEVEESFSFVYILIAVFIGTGLALLIVKFKKLGLWRLWFFLSVFICLTLGLLPYIELLILSMFALNFTVVTYVTIIIAAGLAVWKVFKPNVIVANITEIFIYSGIAALLVPILDLLSAVLLLIVIAIYDIWAVNKTKHMISLANFQTKAKTFAGLSFPYVKNIKPSPNTKKVHQAILGGGDIAFPLLFAGVILKTTGSFALAFLTSFFAAIGLFILFMIAKKGKFYPAMPFITLGSLIGWIITLILT